MDESTRFLGKYRNDDKKPWYAKRKDEGHKKRERSYEREGRKRSRSRSREKEYRKE